MADDPLIARVRAGDLEGVRALVASDVDLDARDAHDWTALCWAAANGHADIVRLLLEQGADVFGPGAGFRTPYQIALAAGHIETARLLAQAEQADGGDAVARSSGQALTRPYCRAYELRDLRQCQAWSEPAGSAETADGESLDDDTVVFLHADFSVTRSIWPGEAVIFTGTAAEWRQFCAETLRFRRPDDFDWLRGVAWTTRGETIS